MSKKTPWYVAEEFVADGLPDLPGQLEVNLSGENLAAPLRRKAFLLKHEFLPNDFELDQWIDPRPLKEAKRIVEARMARATPELVTA
jgi:hypothetical protein